jgi:molecular chaperone DnaJ
LQGLVFLRRGWYDRGYTNIQKAANMDPANFEYRNALNNLNQQYTGYRQNYYHRNSYQSNPDMCNLCMSLWCADSCCECMGGDLIGCC